MLTIAQEKSEVRGTGGSSHPTPVLARASVTDSVKREEFSPIYLEEETDQIPTQTPCNGDPLGEIPQAQLEEINQRWEQFYHEKKNFLYHYAKGDEDLVSIGLLSVRKTLGEQPDCPQSWLVHRAKLDINTARSNGDRLYLSFNKEQQKDSSVAVDKLEYEAMTPLQRNPELVFLDGVKFKKMWEALSEMERKFLLILREEYILETRHRWWDGKYAHTQKGRPQPKKRFRQEVSHSITDYYVSFANIRYQFYLHFGDDEEVQREKAWYASFDPKGGRLHANRDGRYNRG